MRRNRFASYSHGFLGQDGVDPGVIAVQAPRQLAIYPTLSCSEGQAVAVSGQVGSFTAIIANGGSRAAYSVIFTVADGAMAGMQRHRSLLWPSN